MSLQVGTGCIGCGVCEAVCPHRAISQTDDFPVAYAVDPLMCNDCGDCVPLCPVVAIQPDRDWATCHGRGCPLSSRRYAEVACTEGDAELACSACGGPRWSTDGRTWYCPRCDRPQGEGAGAHAQCPKARRVGILARDRTP